MPKAYMAIIVTPNGVWDSTAAVCTGHEAEYRARHWAQMKFIAEMMPQFMRKNLDRAHYALWELAQANGCKCVSREVEIDDTKTQK